VKVGQVCVVRTTLSRPPKDKLTVCICANENLFFWINTEPRAHGEGQFALAASVHPALSHDSYLDCSRVTTFPPVELKAAETRDLISAELASRIVQFLEKTPPKTLAPRYRKLAIDNLSMLCFKP
jgi:hypothetical protein